MLSCLRAIIGPASALIDLQIRAFINDGTGIFTGLPFIDLFIDLSGGGVLNRECNEIPNSWAWDMTVDDFNGDGNVDYAVTRAHHLTVVLGDGAGGALSQHHVNVGGSRDITSGDFDNDGDVDLAAHAGVGCCNELRYFENLGVNSGTFGGPTNIGIGTNGAQVGDFNGDGNLDIASGSLGFSSLRLFWGNGDGTFTPPTLVGTRSEFLQLASDLDGDGDADLVTVSHDGISISFVVVHLNDGVGNFVATDYPADFIPLSTAPNEVVVVDWNEDGIKDLAFSNFDLSIRHHNVRVMFGDGTGSFVSTFDIDMGPFKHVFNLASGNFH